MDQAPITERVTDAMEPERMSSRHNHARHAQAAADFIAAPVTVVEVLDTSQQARRSAKSVKGRAPTPRRATNAKAVALLRWSAGSAADQDGIAFDLWAPVGAPS